MPSKSGGKRQSNFFDTCRRCKTSWSCCNDTTPPVTASRRRVIEGYLEEKGIATANLFSRTEYTFPRLTADGYCVFHDKKSRRCLVHSVKPETCVAGPITFDIDVKSGKIEWFVKMDRICPLSGKVYDDKRLFKKHLRSAKTEILRLVAELDSDELRAVLTKDEPETFKVQEEVLEEKLLRKIAR